VVTKKTTACTSLYAIPAILLFIMT